ncbi:MAG: ATP-dependent sacrificial sulfur transferase LarE [Desulfosarcina sp.]|nr:ATP-dependent sacrificial sulfur transferase LarE [Desulfosarcina sp.]
MPASLQDKQKRLIQVLKTFDRLAVALSGGVDSALLLAEAHAVLDQRVIAVTARSPIHPDADTADAAKIAASLGVPHLIIDSAEMRRADFLANTPERCYICKNTVFRQLLAVIREKGFQHLAHGANVDDRGDYRPGMRAARELGVAAPLMDAGLTKDDIRRMAGDRRLFVWDKPAMACLATRFPYGTPLDAAKIEQVRHAEQVLAAAGFVGCRVRHHGDVARIEVPLDQLPRLVADPLRRRIVEPLRKIGFLHVSVDLEGYVSGSMNRVLDVDQDPVTPVG